MVRVLKQNASESAFILFRDSIGGHTGCNGFKQALPWTSMEEAWSQSLEHPFHQSTTYRYLNEIAAAEYTKHGIVRLPIYNSTLLRRDSHKGGKDCLHYCIPGPSLHWSDMLAAAIKKRASIVAALSQHTPL